MQLVKCWDIQVWDGGDRHNHKYYVSTKEIADEWLKKHPHDEMYQKEFLILESMEEVKDYQHGVIRQRALSKLTEEEKLVLGVK